MAIPAAIEAMVARGDRVLVYRISLGHGDGFQTLRMYPGWNLVSFSVLPTNAAVTKVFTYNGQKVYVGTIWEYVGGGYVAATEVQPKKGYWVYCPFSFIGGEYVELTVFGLKVGGTIPLQTGWNLVGPVKDIDVPTDYTEAAPAASSVKGAVKNDFWWFNAQTGQYDLANSAQDAKGFQIGKGYWIQANRKVDLPATNE